MNTGEINGVDADQAREEASEGIHNPRRVWLHRGQQVVRFAGRDWASEGNGRYLTADEARLAMASPWWICMTELRVGERLRSWAQDELHQRIGRIEYWRMTLDVPELWPGADSVANNMEVQIVVQLRRDIEAFEGPGKEKQGGWLSGGTVQYASPLRQLCIPGLRTKDRTTQQLVPTSLVDEAFMLLHSRRVYPLLNEHAHYGGVEEASE